MWEMPIRRANRRYRAPDKKNRASRHVCASHHSRGPQTKGLDWTALAVGRSHCRKMDGGCGSEVIWSKSNAHPESVRDRPTKGHETVFLLSRSQDYYYKVDAVQGPKRAKASHDLGIFQPSREKRDCGALDDHPAIMPATLAQQCVRLTSKAWRCGAGSLRRVGNDSSGGATNSEGAGSASS